jgi:predicted extracellular nuclease
MSQWGYLDYAMANTSIITKVTGVTIWHTNPDEPRALDYNEEYKSAGQLISLYADDVYRASDHDAIIVGLNLRYPHEVQGYVPLVMRAY